MRRLARLLLAGSNAARALAYGEAALAAIATAATLEADYKRMADDGILLDDAEEFSTLMERCAEIERRINAVRG